MTEKQAFELMKEGDRAAMAWVYENYRDRIARFLMGKPYCCNLKEAKDFALDTVVILGESLEKGKMRELKVPLSTLLNAIAKRIYLAAKRKAKLSSTDWDPLEIPDDEEAFDDDFQDRLEMEEIMENLKPTVQTMGEPCQTILTEYYWNDKTDKEIGMMIEITGAAAKMRRRHCIEILRRLFNNHKK